MFCSKALYEFICVGDVCFFAYLVRVFLTCLLRCAVVCFVAFDALLYIVVGGYTVVLTVLSAELALAIVGVVAAVVVDKVFFLFVLPAVITNFS